MVKQISKDMIVTEVLAVDQDIAAILMQNDMGCIFCHVSEYETLAEACFVHGQDADEIVEQVNEYLRDKFEAEAYDE